MSETLSPTPVTAPFPELPTPPDAANIDGYLDSQQQQINHAQRRMERAANTMERMDHKNALYEHIGHLAVGEPSSVVHRDPDGRPPKARTYFERVRDQRAEKRAEKLAIKQNNFYEAELKYGSIELLPYKGMTKRDQFNATEEVYKRTKREDLSAQESNLEFTRVKAARIPYGREQLKGTQRAVRWSRFKNSLAAKKPVTQWRSFRRNRAIGKIQKNHTIAEHAQRNIDALAHTDGD